MISPVKSTGKVTILLKIPLTSEDQLENAAGSPLDKMPPKVRDFRGADSGVQSFAPTNLPRRLCPPSRRPERPRSSALRRPPGSAAFSERWVFITGVRRMGVALDSKLVCNTYTVGGGCSGRGVQRSPGHRHVCKPVRLYVSMCAPWF